MRKFFLLAFIFIIYHLPAQIQFVKLDSINLRQMFDSKIDWGDYDNDGDLDILISGNGVNGVTINTESYIYRNDGNNLFTNIFATIPNYANGSVKWADIDNDGDLDFLLTGVIGSSGTVYTSLCINNGGDHFELLSPELTNADYGRFCNLNNDGLVDIILYSYDLTILINNGDHSFSEITIDYPENAGIKDISIGDFNNDHYDDFVIIGVENINYESYTRNYIYKNNQNNTFSKIDFEPLESVVAVTSWQDMDSDGDLDLLYNGNLWDSEDHINLIYENLGNDNFSEVSHNLPDFTRPKYGFADYDNNGFIDLIISGYFIEGENEETHIFKNQGGWNFIEDLNTSFESNNIFDVEFADIDRDKDLDIGVTVFSVWQNITYISKNQSNGNYNIPPEVPNQLISEINAGNLLLTWEKAEDQETLIEALTYNLYIIKDDQIIINPNAILSTGYGKLVGPGNQGFNNGASYNITNWEEGHYFWGVQTIDQGYLASNFSEANEFTIYHNNLSDAPTGLEVTNADLSAVLLSWDDNSNDEVSFIIERSEITSNNFVELALLDANMTVYNDLTIQPLSDYYYRVKMTNSSEETGYSEIKYIKTLPAIENSPTELIAIPESASEISLSWIDNNNDETGYVIESSVNNSENFHVLDSLSADVTEYLNTGLNSGTNYYYRVKAINEAGQSEYSNIANTTTKIIRFTITDGVLGEINNSEGMAWGDFDNDNLEDLFISSYPVALYKNNGDATYSLVNNTGIEIESDEYSVFGLWGDYDNDGFLDLFVTGDKYPNRIFHNNGNSTFTKLLTGEIVEENIDTRSVSWNDYDNDGDLDVFIANDGYNFLYNYNGHDIFNKVFIDESSSSHGMSWGDYNNDGFIDLYVANDKKNGLFRNNVNGNLEKITEGQIVNNEEYHTSLSATWGDYNNDGFIDILINNYRSTEQWVYRNNGDETFTKVENIPHFPHTYYSVYTGFWFDYDNDADLDVYLFSNTYETHTHKLFTNIGNDTFTYSEVDFGDDVSYYTNFGSCYDYNNDGFSDILINRAANQVLANQGNANNWIKIVLKGSPSNSFGVGAQVKIKTGKIWQTSTVSTLSAYHSQNGNILNFGLKDVEVIDSLIVFWPMGTIQTLTNIGVNQKIEIFESDAENKPVYKPSNLNSKPGWGHILLNWKDNAVNEQNYLLERSAIDTANFNQIALLGQNVTEYADSTIVNSILYYYRLKAVRGDSSSYWSNITSNKINYYVKSTDSIFQEDNNQSECVAWIDYNNDDLLDLYVGNKDSNDILYQNNSNGLFTKVVGTPLTKDNTITNFGAWADYDNNGFADLFVANGWNNKTPASGYNNNLFKNNGNGEFIQIGEGELVTESYQSYVGAWADYNQDGLLDIFVGNNSNSSILFANKQNDVFAKVLDQPDFNISASDAVWTDFDLDNDLDLITVMNFNYQSFNIIENIDSGNFVKMDVSQIGLSSSIKANSINVEDFNNDGLFDIFFARDGKNQLFINNNGYYEELLNSVIGEDSQNSRNSVCADFNNDGYIDLFVSNYKSPNYLYLNNGDLTFTKLVNEPMSENSTQSASSAFGDYNNDGKIDLFTVNDNTINNLYINQLTGSNWLVIKLKSNANKNIIGTKIELHINDEIQIREVRTNSGKGAQNALDVYFGLGENRATDFVKIISPNGAITIIDDFKPNQINEINFDLLDIYENSQSKFSIYPNPANNMITIVLPEIGNVKLLKIQNSSGITIKQLPVNGEKRITMPLNDIPAGYYSVLLFSANKILRGKLIIGK